MAAPEVIAGAGEPAKYPTTRPLLPSAPISQHRPHAVTGWRPSGSPEPSPCTTAARAQSSNTLCRHSHGPCYGVSGASADQVVKLAVLDSPDERGDLGGSVDQRRAAGMARITHGDRPARECGYLHAVPVRVAVVTLAPHGPPNRGSGHAITGLKHQFLTFTALQSGPARGTSPARLRQAGLIPWQRHAVRRPGRRRAGTRRPGSDDQHDTAMNLHLSLQQNVLADVFAMALASA